MKLTILSTLVYQIFANQHGTPVIITEDNEGSVLAESEVVFVAFVAEWCHFSRMLTPVWNEAAKALATTYPKEKLSLGVVQTDKQGASLGQKYAVNKFPTMKLLETFYLICQLTVCLTYFWAMSRCESEKSKKIFKKCPTSCRAHDRHRCRAVADFEKNSGKEGEI